MRQSASFFNRSRIMTSSPPAVSPLRMRMIDDMRMRQLSPKTQANYLRIVREFARFLGRSPDTATVEDLRGHQLHLVDHGTSPISLNAAITGLKFFFEITLYQPERMARMQPVRVPRTLPVVLSPDEVRRLIAAAGSLKHQTALAVVYGAGLRASEVVALKVSDVDSQRMTLRIERGKGPPNKRVSMHTLRHSFATHLLDRRSTSASSRCCLATRSSRPLRFTCRWPRICCAKSSARWSACAAGEFMRRFLLHVLPTGFHRIRHYGLLANPVRRANLAKVRALLDASCPNSPPPI
jgi:integrase